MKRTLLSVLAGIICITTFAQTPKDIAGNWFATQTEVDDGDTFTVNDYLEFNEDGTVTNHGDVNMEINFDAETQFHASFTYSAKGTWSLDNGIISFKYNPKSISLVMSNENNMPGIIKMMVINPMKSEFVKEMKKRSPARVVSYSPTELVLLDTEGKENTEDVYKKQ